MREHKTLCSIKSLNVPSSSAGSCFNHKTAISFSDNT